MWEAVESILFLPEYRPLNIFGVCQAGEAEQNCMDGQSLHRTHDIFRPTYYGGLKDAITSATSNGLAVSVLLLTYTGGTRYMQGVLHDTMVVVEAWGRRTPSLCSCQLELRRDFGGVAICSAPQDLPEFVACVFD